MSNVKRLIESDRNWLSTLRDTYKISVAEDGDLVSLKYNQIESPMDEPIVQECRGMVVDVPNGRILAHPYNKFWNHGDRLAAEIDWESARVLEKLDGSLMILYWDPNAERWSVASSGTPRGSGTFGDNEGETFGQAFWRTFEALEMRLPRMIDTRSITFCFEFCDQPNRIVVKHDRPRIVLHGGRDISSGIELDRCQLELISSALDWELVNEYPLASISDCLAAAESLDPIQCEGFIVVDAQFNRIKIKSPRYVILHHMKGEASLRRSIELWQTGESAELLLHFPEMGPQILPVHDRLDALAEEAAILASFHADLDRKSFAEHVKDTPHAPVAFKLYGVRGKQSSADDAKAIMRAQTIQSLERMLERAA